MSNNEGISKVGNLIWDSTNKKWIPQTVSLEELGFTKLINSDDLVTVIQYNEPDSRTTVSGITYTSPGLGTSATETFVSGTNVLTITRELI
jgi:hypothetical protein